MIFLKIFLFISLINLTLGDVASHAGGHKEGNLQGSNERSKCNLSQNGWKEKEKKPSLYLKQPFLDMNVEKEKNIILLQEREKKLLFLLHGNELYQVFISVEEKKLDFVGYINEGKKDNEILGGQMIHWNNNIILAIAYGEYINIYQIPLNSLYESPANFQGKLRNFDLIQQLRMPGTFQKLYLLQPDEDKVMLIIIGQFTKLYAKLRCFQWHHTYFDPIEDLTVPQIHYAKLIGTSSKYLITGRAIRAQDKAIVNVYEITKPTMNLRNIQTLTVGAKKVHAFSLNKENYLLACSSKAKRKCNSFKMSEKQFYLFRQNSEKDYVFDQLEAGDNYFVGIQNSQVKVFMSPRKDCHLSFVSSIPEISAVVTFQNNRSENFILLHYSRPFTSTIRIIEIQVDEEDAKARNEQTNRIDEETPQKHQHLFESTVGKLRTLLLKRRLAMEVFRSISNNPLYQQKYYETKKPIKILSGKIDTVKLIGSNLASPMQLLERIDSIRKSLKRERHSRAITLKDVKRKLPTSLKVNKLRVGNLIYDKPLLNGFYLEESTKSLPILSIRRPIKTKKLTTERLLTRTNYRQLREASGNNSTLLKLTNLNVEYINGIRWADFYDSLFLKGRDKTIKGRLIFQESLTVGNLNTRLLNGLVVDKLFNLVTPQVVSSNIVFRGFFVPELHAERINGLNFAEDLVFRGEDTFIETPVSFHQISVAGDLFIENSTDSDMNMERKNKQANETNLFQHYTRPVIIEGSLTVNSFERELGERTKIIVNNTIFSKSELRENYLLNNTDQVFMKPVIFGNAQIKAPRLDTTYLNNHLVEDHLLNQPDGNGKEEDKLANPPYLLFMNATIKGDLICKNYTSMLRKLAENVVYRGQVANITGEKVFEAPLKIDGLMTLALNDLPVKDLVLKSELLDEVVFTGTKVFEEIIVEENVTIENQLEAEMLNNFPLNDLLNYDYHFDRLVVEDELDVFNMVFHKINGISFDDVWLKLNVRNDQLILQKDLIIVGNVEFASNLNVKYINNVEWDPYVQSLVKNNENAVIEGTKTFLSDLTITRHFNSKTINGIDLSAILSNILRKSVPQEIKAPYTFQNMKVGNIDVSVINGLPTSAFIDLRQKEIIIDSDVIAEEVNIQGNVEAKFEGPLPFEDLENKIENLLQKPWKNIRVLGNATWPTEGLSAEEKAQENLFAYLYKNAVRKDADQIISGAVTMNRPIIVEMFTKHPFPKNFDLQALLKDCLLKNTSQLQVIKGPTTFLKPIHAENVFAAGPFYVDFLNGIDILRLNASLYRRSSGLPIIGPLTFLTPPTIHNCAVEGTINQIHPSQIYYSSDKNREVPPLRVKHFIFDNLTIGDINDMSFEYFLENRITKTGEPLEVFGNLTFENLKILKHANIQTFNGIPLENLVYKKSKHLQAITGNKIIKGDLILKGPAHALKLNNFDLLDLYKKSILTDENYHFKELIVEDVTFEKGLVFLNEKDNSSTSNEKRHLKNLNTSENSLPQEPSPIDINDSLLYLDYDFNKIISWHKPNNETIQNSLTILLSENSPIVPSPCDRETLNIHQTSQPNFFLLEKLTSNTITSQTSSLQVNVENFCKFSTKFKIKSRLSLSSGSQPKNIGLKNFITKLHILPIAPNKHLLLLHLTQADQSANEIRILKIDEKNLTNIETVQKIPLGFSVYWKFIDLPQQNQSFLVTSHIQKSFQGVQLYALNSTTKRFEQFQNISGDFDIIDFLHFDNLSKYQLLLSCHHCHEIKIFQTSALSTSPLDSAKLHFEHFQTLKLFSHIDILSTFPLMRSPHDLTISSNHFIMVFSKRLKSNDHFLTIFEFTHHWHQHTFGELPNVSMLVPLTNFKPTHPPFFSLNENILLILCGTENRCSFVKAIIG